MDHTFEQEIIVNQPIDVVFRNISCLKGCINWSTLLHETEKLDDEPVHVGSRYRHVGGFMGMKTESIAEVKVYNPPYEFASGDSDSSKSMMPVEFRYTLSEVPGGTRIHNTFTFKSRSDLIGRAAASVLIPRLRKQIESDLHLFKEQVDAGMIVHAQ